MKRTFEQTTLGDSKTVPQAVATIISLMGEGKSADEIAHALSKGRKELLAQISFYEDGSPFSFLKYMIKTREYSQYYEQKPVEAGKLIDFLLGGGVSVSETDLLESPEFARLLVCFGKQIHWKLHDKVYFFQLLLSRLIKLKTALPEIAGILETEEVGKLLKMDIGSSIDIMGKAFAWLSIDRTYANGLIDWLSRHGERLTRGAIEIDAQRALQLVGDFPDPPMLKDPVKGVYLLTDSIMYCKNPIEMLKILMDSPREKQILAIFNCKRDSPIWRTDPLIEVLKRMNTSLSLDQCLELIDFLLAKGQPLLPDHFTLIRARSEGPAQKRAISVVIMRNFFRVMKLSPGDVSSMGTLLSVMEYLIGIKCPFSEIEKILDFAKSQSWNEYFKINLVLKIFGLELLRTRDSDNNNETYVLSPLELLSDHGFSPDLIFRHDDILKGETTSELAVRLMLRLRDMGKIEKLLTAFQKPSLHWDSMPGKLIARLSPTNTRHIEAIFAQVALLPGLCGGGNILKTLRAQYLFTKDEMLKNSLSGMIAAFMEFHKPMALAEVGPVLLQDSISSAFKLRQETRHYFESFLGVITDILITVFPKVLIQMVNDYLTPPSLLSAMASFPTPEKKDMRYKLAVPCQAPDSSDCGAHALTNALSGAAFITENIEWWAAIHESKPSNSSGEDKDVPRTLLENALDQIIKKAVQFRQGDNDTSPVVMRKLIKQDDSKLIKVIRDFNQADPTLVPINTEKPEGAYIGTFEASAQLQMLNNMIHIFDRLQKGEPVGGYPFLIFLKHHWITALCFGRLFLICDSSDGNPDYLSAVCRPIQEAITQPSTLKELCKTVLAQAYAEFTFFQEKEIKSPEDASRQITGLFQAWLGIVSNVHLQSVLETGDVLKFKQTLDLSKALKEWGSARNLPDSHSSLASKILKNPTLFSQEIKYFPVQFKISKPDRDNHLAIAR